MSKLGDIVKGLNAELGDTNIMSGKTHMKYDALVALYPERPADPKFPKAAVVHLTGLAYVETGKFKKPYCSFSIAEDDSIFSTSSGDFLKTYEYLLSQCGGDSTALNEMLAATPLKIRTWKKNTKGGGLWTKVMALGFVNTNDEPEADPDTGEVVTTEDTPF